jgi:hypothetical protein
MGSFGAIAQDIAEVQLDATCSDAALDLSLIAVAHEGSQLAKALVKPAEVADAAALLPSGDAITTISGTIDPRATGALVSTVLRRLARDQHLPLDEGVFAAADLFGVDATGAFALQSVADPAHGARCALVHGVTSIQAGKNLEARIIELFAPGKALAETSAKLGVPLRVASHAHVRESQGQTIDRIEVSFGEIAWPPEQQAALLALVRDGEVAYSERWVLYDQDPASLDRVIARAAHPGAETASAKARAAFGADHALYVACDVAAMIVATTARTASVPATPSPLASLPVGDPVLMAGDLERGSMRWRARLPRSPVAPLARAIALAMFSELLEKT